MQRLLKEQMPIPGVPVTDSPRPSGHARRVTIAIYTVVLVAIAAGWYALMPTSPKRFQSAVDELQAGSLNPTRAGRVDLSGRFPGLTPRDEAFVTYRPDGSLLAMFPTYYSKGTDIAGLMFTSRPLLESDTYAYHRDWGVDRRHIDVGAFHRLCVDSRVDEHWYRVSYGLKR